MRVALVVAVARNAVIGRNNSLPWNLPGDLRHFRQLTMGKPVIMGRRTFESIGRPLPGRSNIVLTRSQAYAPDGIIVVDSLKTALQRASAIAEIDGVDEVMVIGGGELYRQALPEASRIYMTRVHSDVEGDAFFPTLDETQWRQAEREDHPANGNDSPAFSLVVLERR